MGEFWTKEQYVEVMRESLPLIGEMIEKGDIEVQRCECGEKSCHGWIIVG